MILTTILFCGALAQGAASQSDDPVTADQLSAAEAKFEAMIASLVSEENAQYAQLQAQTASMNNLVATVQQQQADFAAAQQQIAALQASIQQLQRK